MSPHDEIAELLGGPGTEEVQTHCSRVFLHERDVYKIKKPVRFPFLDYSTLALRHEACEQELEVNRRAAADVYLGLLAVVRDEGGALALRKQVGDGADVVEWVVHMRRLPDVHRADLKLADGTLQIEDVQRIAAYLADFHARVEHVTGERAVATFQALRENAEENLDSLLIQARQRLGSDGTRRLREEHLGTLESLESVFRARIARGRVVDGHGDFRLEHVYLDESGDVTLLDALEFNPAFRIADACADVAFLAMDLSVRGRSDLAELFLAAYARESGDHELYRIVDFYMTYWALVRAKVDATRAEQLEQEAADAALEACSRRLFLASHLAHGSPRGRMIVAVTGLIACGKSRVARMLADHLAAPVLSSDRIRKQLAEVAPTENLGTEPYTGAYSEAATDAVYAEILERARLIVESGRPVVLDASFQHESARIAVGELAARLGVPHLFVECAAPREEIQARLERRAGRQHDSDARAPLLTRFESQYPDWSGAAAEHHVSVDTSQAKAVVDQEVLRHIRSLRRESLTPRGVSVGQRSENQRPQ